MPFFSRGSTIPLMLGDLATLSFALLATLMVRYGGWPSPEVLSLHVGPFLGLFVVWLLVYFIAGLYDRHVSLVRKSIPALVIKTQFLNVLLAAVVFFMLPLAIEPKTNLFIYLILSTVLMVVWRLYVYPRLVLSRPVCALVIGDSEEATAIGRVFVGNPYFRNIKAFVLARTDIPDFAEYRQSLLSFLQNNHTDMIIADLRDPFAQALVNDLYAVAFEHRDTRFFNLPTVYEQLVHRVPPTLVEESWLLTNVTTATPHYAYDFVKRGIDIVGALVLLIPTVFLFPLIALAIKLEDKGPIFYRAARVGQYGRTIYIYKFRSKTGLDTSQSALKSELVDTRVGAFMRKTRLDELPQLLNVLRGDLSFIGPRPEIPSLVEVYRNEIPYYHLRHLVKPGLSGWAQIHNYDVPRGGVDIPRTVDKLSFDLYYLKYRSLLLDIEIALKTLSTLIMRSGT